jgi:AcrR family transcriptional regulator
MPDASTRPRGIRALWHGPETGRRGPKPTTSVQEIAEHAIALADAEGLEAASLAAVASRLGLTTMSLYRYVDSRDDLRAVMVDVAMGPLRLTRRGWRRRLEEWAHADFAQLMAHPWVLDVHDPEPPVGPNMLAWTDAGMGVLLDAGLDPQTASSSLLAVDGLARHSAQIVRQYSASGADAAWASRLREVVDADRLPALHAVLSAGALEDEGGLETDLDVGLGLLLDGIAARLAG